MTEKFLIRLDAKGKWALGADALQWIIYRVNTSKGKEVLQGQSFINWDQDSLQNCFRYHGVNLTDEAKAALAELPFTFKEFAELYKPKSGKGRKGSDGPKVPVVSPATAKWNGYDAARNQEAKNCPHRTGTALAKEWFIGFDAYTMGESEPHKPTPRTEAKPKDVQAPAMSVDTFGNWNKTPNIPAHMIIKPEDRR